MRKRVKKLEGEIEELKEIMTGIEKRTDHRNLKCKKITLKKIHKNEVKRELEKLVEIRNKNMNSNWNEKIEELERMNSEY